jgi:Protein of unknown function (DUF1580)
MGGLIGEGLVDAGELARGLDCHVASVLRWLTRGVRGRDGTRVRLEGVRVGGRWKSTWPAAERFLARLNPAAATDGQPDPVPVRAPGQPRRADDRAAQELVRGGAHA